MTELETAIRNPKTRSKWHRLHPAWDVTTWCGAEAWPMDQRTRLAEVFTDDRCSRCFPPVPPHDESEEA